MKSILLVLTSTYLASCTPIPPPHPVVVAVRQEEELLPLYLKSPHNFNPHLQQILPLTSLLHHGEKPVYHRDTDDVSRQEVYNILTHAGFIPRRPLHYQPEPGYQHVIMPPTSCKALVKDYCSNCSFAGVHFIADDTKHWSERLLWLALVTLSWYGSGILIIAAWDAFVQSPISFGVETTYTDWETKMPSVAICETSNDEKIYNVSDTIWTPDHLLDLEDALKDIAYFRGVTYTLVELCHLTNNPDPQCPMSNFSYYANLIRSDCHHILKNCSYNDKAFDCCEYFLPLDTDMGKCYAINSIQTMKQNPYPMIGSMKNQRCVIRFEVLIPSSMYTLGDDEVPTITSLQSSSMKIQIGYSHRRQVAVRNIENDPLVVQTTPKQRACNFHNENEDGLYPHHSYSACTVLCRKRAQLSLCQCNDHFMLGTTEEERCNISGLSCLHKYASHLTTLKPRWATRPGLTCNCIPSCTETEITVVKDVVIPNKSNRKKTSVEMILAYLPTERFKRNVIRSRLDLVVSVGGTAGLFVGASLLSFVELLFYFTIRYGSNILLERKRLGELKKKKFRQKFQIRKKLGAHNYY
ncbi:sodium channel protein Nach-like [Hyposmocoma kahamanoa]|uniref:sodium channel protein Nach-like n=1 Tax=Hyposmocoma kahamanoa TaxID=1477025 RepID=UPI000E6D6F3D|nr:sodium channel protein Nach-like [Hyposmocoma kahamanoa]